MKSLKLKAEKPLDKKDLLNFGFSLLIGLSISFIIYLLFSDGYLVSKKYLLYSIILIIILSTISFFINRYLLFPSIKNHPEDLLPLIFLVIVVLWTGFSQGLFTRIPSAYLFLPKQQVRMEFQTYTEENSSSCQIEIDGTHVGFRWISLDELGNETNSKRVGDNFIITKCGKSEIDWEGRIYKDLIINFVNTPNDGNAKIFINNTLVSNFEFAENNTDNTISVSLSYSKFFLFLVVFVPKIITAISSAYMLHVLFSIAFFVKNTISNNAAYLIAIILLSISILFIAYIGAFSRTIADDYCGAARTKSYGVFEGAIRNYLTWNGRYTSNFFEGLFGLSKLHFLTPFLPIIYIAVLGFAIFLIMKKMQLSVSNRKKIVFPLELALAIISIYLFTMPSIEESLYWKTGAITYFLPIIFFAFCINFIISFWMRVSKGNFSRVNMDILLAFMLVIFIGGFNEIVAVYNVSISAFMLLGLLLRNNKRKEIEYKYLLKFTVLIFFGALISIALVFFSPGNKFRQAGYSPPPEIIEIIKIAFMGTISYFGGLFKEPINVVNFVGLFSLASSIGRKISIIKTNQSAPTFLPSIIMIVLPFLVLFFIFESFLPGAYGQSRFLPERAISNPHFIFVFSCAIYGVLWGYMQKKIFSGKDLNRLRMILITFFITIAPVFSAYELWQNTARLRIYADDWDVMNKQIINAVNDGKEKVEVVSNNGWASLDGGLRPDPKFWVNRCAMEYYGIEVRVVLYK